MPVAKKKTLKQVVKGKTPRGPYGLPKKRNTKCPLWKGPEVDGVTQSMLGSFLVCRERFRLKVIEGLAEADEFSHALEYGNLWHVCEEHGKDYAEPLKAYTKSLCRKYPLQQEQIVHWMKVCKTQFPVYIKHWKNYNKREKIETLRSEQVFSVPYKLPSGRAVILRGKWDNVCTAEKKLHVWENKTKGEIVEQLLTRQLTFDLQTMFYFVAFQENTQQGYMENYGDPKGLIYNVVRRPLAGGKGSIRKHQPTKSNPLGETDEHFYGRLQGIIEEDPEYFFMRWKVGISKADAEKFKREFLNPILEQLCQWYDFVTCNSDPFSGKGPIGIHWRHPYGVWNPMDRRRPSEMDDYMASGSELGLVHKDKLFEELN